MSDDEKKRLEQQVREDRKLIRKAEQTLAEIDRGPGLSNEQADVLAALRIRLEGKPRKSSTTSSPPPETSPARRRASRTSSPRGATIPGRSGR